MKVLPSNKEERPLRDLLNELERNVPYVVNNKRGMSRLTGGQVNRPFGRFQNEARMP